MRYLIADGVRRAKAAEVLGLGRVPAVDLASGRDLVVSLESLLSPRPTLETAGVGLDRWIEALRSVASGTYAPIVVEPGAQGIPLRLVGIE